jgi:hypothetical protein
VPNPCDRIGIPLDSGDPPPATVYSEDLTGAIYLDKPPEIDMYEEVWTSLDKQVLTPEQSIELMSHRLKELTDREA